MASPISHYNPYAFDGRGSAIVLAPGLSAAEVRVGPLRYQRHGNLDHGREVWVAYGGQNAYGPAVLTDHSGEKLGVEIPRTSRIVRGNELKYSYQPGGQEGAQSRGGVPAANVGGGIHPAVTLAYGAEKLAPRLTSAMNVTKLPAFASNAVFGTSTNAIPGAVGSFKGPAAFASKGAATSGSSAFNPGLGIGAALLGFGLASRMSAAKKDARTLERAGQVSNWTQNGQYATGSTGNRSYVVAPRLANYQQQTLRNLGGPLLEGVMGENLKRGVPTGSQTLYEYSGKAPSMDGLTSYQQWLNTMPRFNQSDQGQYEAEQWLKANPFEAFQPSSKPLAGGSAPQAAARPKPTSAISKSLAQMTSSRPKGSLDYGSWLRSQGMDPRNKQQFVGNKAGYQSYLRGL